MNNLKKNFIYNVLYQILILIIPLITIPYVSRILGVNGIGEYSYTYSIVYYFMLASMLGINNYGNRTIAKIRDNKNQLSKNFFEIYSIQLIMTVLMILCYLVYIMLFSSEYMLVSMLQTIYLASCMFDINWFFFGLEKFKITVTRNTILKILSLILIFIFVNDKNDVWLYTLILSLSTLLSQILLLSFLVKEVSFVKVKINDIKKHIKPCLILFLPVIAVSLYKVMDKIMLGSMTSISEVGFYEQAEKIVTVPMGVVTALGTVMLPRMSNLVAKGDDNSISKYIKKSSQFMMFLAFPICFGLIAISSDFVPLFLGNEFIKSRALIYYLSFTILFISFANVIRTQYLIPKEKDKVYVVSVFLGAIINLIVNFILIPKYLSIGACIGTIMAEFFVMLYQIIAIRKELPIFGYLKDSNCFLWKSLIMFVIVTSIKYLNLSPIITIILQIIIGCTIYFILNWNYIDSIVNIKKIIKKL